MLSHNCHIFKLAIDIQTSNATFNGVGGEGGGEGGQILDRLIVERQMLRETVCVPTTFECDCTCTCVWKTCNWKRAFICSYFRWWMLRGCFHFLLTMSAGGPSPFCPAPNIACWQRLGLGLKRRLFYRPGSKSILWYFAPGEFWSSLDFLPSVLEVML